LFVYRSTAAYVQFKQRGALYVGYFYLSYIKHGVKCATLCLHAKNSTKH